MSARRRPRYTAVHTSASPRPAQRRAGRVREEGPGAGGDVRATVRARGARAHARGAAMRTALCERSAGGSSERPPTPRDPPSVEGRRLAVRRSHHNCIHRRPLPPATLPCAPCSPDPVSRLTITTTMALARAAARAMSTAAGAAGKKVSVLGAAGGIGQPLSLLLKEHALVSDLSLFDIVNTPGVAADLSHINTGAKVRAAAARNARLCAQGRPRATLTHAAALWAAVWPVRVVSTYCAPPARFRSRAARFTCRHGCHHGCCRPLPSAGDWPRRC